MPTAKQRQRIENAWQQAASPLPIPRPRRRWVVLAAGVLVGITLSKAHLWLVTPITPEAPEQECLFSVPELKPGQSLEPVMTAGEWEQMQAWLKANPGAYPSAPAAPELRQPQTGC